MTLNRPTDRELTGYDTAYISDDYRAELERRYFWNLGYVLGRTGDFDAGASIPFDAATSFAYQDGFAQGLSVA